MHLLVFDSGIGGLGVVREIRRLQPHARISYLADIGFFPYGEKPDAVLLPHIVGLIGKAIEFLKPDAVVVACNTASTIALAALRAAYALPFIGCVPPIKPAAAASKTRVIGILATAATVRRAYLRELIEAFAPDCEIHSLGAPTLAELAERKFRGQAVDVASAVAPLFSQPGAERIDAVALGCTHYTFLHPEFEALYPDVKWFDPALPVARRTLAVTEGFSTAPEPQAEVAWFTAALPDLDVMRPRLAEFGFYEIRQGPCFS
ncbi:glutamate racemase [Acidocella aquatica]|uniref:Glutamate racemase n=1 Tax=Acidocella aquatica TaxID=1922313 RepID=A0ABQ6A8R3_9PROT|nr:glutamate racemase [Acidocella aquatica]GLR67695.1 glutamate racemase [Acidocella aquatica]